jgi:hypothetical protein
MCQSKAEGGTRCDYADQVANVRRKARYQHRGKWDAEQLTQKDVEDWKEQNHEIVEAHLPEKLPFQVEARVKRIPENVKALLTASPKDSITGFEEEKRHEHTLKMYEENKELKESLTKDEDTAVHFYAMNDYEMINRMLRRNGVSSLTKREPNLKKNMERYEASIKHIDSAIKKVEEVDEPRKLYRFFKVPPGVSTDTYIEKYFKKGEGFQDKGFTSTTADPEFIIGQLKAFNKSDKKDNNHYVVMEIISKKGVSMQSKKRSTSGHLQSLEKEVILPRIVKFRIADSRKRQAFEFADERKDLHSRFGSYDRGEAIEDFSKGKKYRFPLIQLVDEDLI